MAALDHGNPTRAYDSLPKVYFLAEKITASFGDALLQQSNIFSIPSLQPLVVLDNACGIGIITSQLLGGLPQGVDRKLKVTCLEISPPLINYLKLKSAEEDWEGVEIYEGDAQDTKLPSQTFTHVFTNFGPLFFKDPAASMRESFRVLQCDGRISFSLWKVVGWQEDLAAAIKSVMGVPPFPTNAQLVCAYAPDEGYNDEASILRTTSGLGFTDVEINAVEKQSVLADVDEYMLMHGTVMNLFMNFWAEEDKEKYRHKASVAIEKYLRQKYGSGPVTWKWVALLVTAKKPVNS